MLGSSIVSTDLPFLRAVGFSAMATASLDVEVDDGPELFPSSAEALPLSTPGEVRKVIEGVVRARLLKAGLSTERVKEEVELLPINHTTTEQAWRQKLKLPFFF
jgi:hypothetical protein